MKLNRKALLAAIESVSRARELRVSDTTAAKMVVEAYLTTMKAQNERAFAEEMTSKADKGKQ